MRIAAIIPARYHSSRLPGKPLVDICGKPMIWWVYQQVAKITDLDGIYVATDDERVENVCNKYKIPVVMTSPSHRTHVDRLHEVSHKVQADLYVCVCGDEPLIEAETIQKIIPSGGEIQPFIARSLMREFNDPAELVDPSNIKVVTNRNGDCLLLTRSIVPYPYKTVQFKYKKVVGIECFNKAALDFFANQPIGLLEEIEDITLLRFVEHHKPVKYIMTDAHQLGVDTPSDLEKVRTIIARRVTEQNAN